MAKTAKLKTKSKSIHSRAARRAALPSNEIDKSLTSVPRAETAASNPSSVLASHANAGVSKKKATPKSLTRAQRLRQQKGIERAEIVLNQLENKVAKSYMKTKEVKIRNVKWEDLNGRHGKGSEDYQGTQDAPLDDPMMREDQPTIPAASSSILPTTNFHATSYNQVADEHEAVEDGDEIT